MSEGEPRLPKEEKDRLESMDETLKEILKWTRFANISKLKETLEKELDTEEKKLAHESSDAENGLKEVAAASNTPLQTVANWWPRWFRLGLVTESETRKGRMMKIISLEDVGLKVPKKRGASTQASTQATTQDVTRMTTPEGEVSDRQKSDENSS
jgi:uncharacterized protein (UPF0147 family)